MSVDTAKKQSDRVSGDRGYFTLGSQWPLLLGGEGIVDKWQGGTRSKDLGAQSEFQLVDIDWKLLGANLTLGQWKDKKEDKTIVSL